MIIIIIIDIHSNTNLKNETQHIKKILNIATSQQYNTNIKNAKKKKIDGKDVLVQNISKSTLKQR